MLSIPTQYVGQSIYTRLEVRSGVEYFSHFLQAMQEFPNWYTHEKGGFGFMDKDEEREARLELVYEEDGAEVLTAFIELVANTTSFLAYKSIIQTGSKAGESLWAHIINLVMIAEKLRPLFELKGELEDKEMQCILLALVIHDLNKLDGYGKLSNGKSIRYAQVTLIENIAEVLADFKLDHSDPHAQSTVDLFFPEWRDYLQDIKYLADGHQEQASVESQHNQKVIDQCKLDSDRLEGPLRYLMKAIDVSDNSHAGDYTTWHEGHIRYKLMNRLNEALHQGSMPRRYRFVGYRLAEFRGLQTNIIHKKMISFLLTMYGEEACIDLLYHANGTDFLLDRRIPFTWTPQMQKDLAKEIGLKFAELQAKELAQFIKARPSGIAVDSAATESGAALSRIFQTIVGVVARKQYRPEWREQRHVAIRADLEKFLAQEQDQSNDALHQQVRALLTETSLLPADEQLKGGEFVIAYRNFLKDHRDSACRILKQDAWQRVARLFQLPEEKDGLYALIDPYRRGYVMARDLPTIPLQEMMLTALDDLEQLEKELQTRTPTALKKTLSPQEVSEPSESEEKSFDETLDVAAIEDYLARNLQVWDDSASMPVVGPVAFHETLQRYVQDANPERQCCYCGSALKADEWMAAQVPSSIGVQSFSNRLEGGSSHEPKRNVCAICRNQFILEKLAWSAHKDKHGKDEVTYYLHLFSYSFLTKPLLDAWWQSIQRFRDGDYKALFLNTKEYFLHWTDAYAAFQSPVYVTNRGIDGVGIPTFSEAMSNTPVLPLNIPGGNAGCRFLLALEKTVILANWFDCRIILSGLPTPLVNLEQERRQTGDVSEPIALLVENVPHVMNWLLPSNTLTRSEVASLCESLSVFHQIAALIAPPEEVAELVISRLVTAAAHDPLALYYEVDRQIERMVAKQKSSNPEQRALHLSARIAPLIEKVLKQNKGIHV